MSGEAYFNSSGGRNAGGFAPDWGGGGPGWKRKVLPQIARGEGSGNYAPQGQANFETGQRIAANPSIPTRGAPLAAFAAAARGAAIGRRSANARAGIERTFRAARGSPVSPGTAIGGRIARGVTTQPRVPTQTRSGVDTDFFTVQSALRF